jgi:hypothetical protein
MRVTAAVSCGLLATCLAACDGHADGKCTAESLKNGKAPPELALLVGQRDGAGLAGALCTVKPVAPWTIMFADGVLNCSDETTCTLPKIGGITFRVHSAVQRVNTANVALSEDRLGPLLRDVSVRYIAPNCVSTRERTAIKTVQYRTAVEPTRPAEFVSNSEHACQRHDSAQWGLSDACVPASRQEPLKPKVVAILDTGVDCMHPSISGRVGDGSEPVEPYRCPESAGTNYVNEKTPPDHCTRTDTTECISHGTAVAGIIASSAPEAPGVDPRARLKSMRVLLDDSDLEFVQPWTKVAKAILDSGDAGAQIINISANWYTNYPWLAAAIDEVTAEHRRLVVSAARLRNGRIAYPAAFTKCNDAVIGVTNIIRNPNKWPPYDWSMGDSDEAYMVAAGSVLTSYSDEHTLDSEESESMYRTQSGSSFAAPHVSGAASLVWSTKGFENCTAEGIRELLECSARTTLIGQRLDARKRLHLGCLFVERNSAICRGPKRCIESVKKQHCR